MTEQNDGTTRALRNLRAEVSQTLRTFAFFTQSMKQTVRLSEEEVDNSDGQNFEPLTHTFSPSLSLNIVNHPRALSTAAKKTFYPILIDMLLVRTEAILEVFFSDICKTIYLKRKDLLQKRYKVMDLEGVPALSVPKLLTYRFAEDLFVEYVEHEARSLSNKSFTKVGKYYKTCFDIPFSEYSGDLKLLEDVHKRRNNIVHGLGNLHTDRRARLILENKRLKTSKSYLVRSLQEILNFAEYIDGKVQNLLVYGDKGALSEIATAICSLTVEVYSLAGTQATMPSYTYVYMSRVQALRPLLFSRTDLPEQIVVMELRGKREEVRMYLRHLRHLETSADVKIMAITFKRYIGKKRKTGVHGFVAELDALLPMGDLPLDTARRVAETLNYNASTAKQLIEEVRVNRLPSEIRKAIEAEVNTYMVEPTGNKVPVGLHTELSEKLDIPKSIVYKYISRLLEIKDAEKGISQDVA